MPYATYNDIAALIPPAFLVQALDDNGDGAADDGVFDLVLGQVSDDINGYLGLRYALPLGEPYPDIVVSAARVFVAEKLYKRRGTADEANPWSAEASQKRTILKDISLGKAPLSPTIDRQDPSASIITQPMRSTPQGRDRLSV